MKSQAVAVDEHGVIGQVDRPVVVGPCDVGVAEHVDEQSGEVDIVPLEVAPLVEAREQQQVLDERGHPLRLRLHPAERMHDIGWEIVAAASRELGVAADRAERRA